MGARSTITAIARARVLGVSVALAAFALFALKPVTVLAAAPQEGMAAPAFSLRSLDAKPWSLAQTRGHVVVLNFFATWCP
ncbi:MAG: redoxin family protein, partial [Candidatus Eremiobacteraeota bacterium]|nr:redoxin family protein [Candidatus Eremiobacteraeota bacterium]